MGRATVGEFEYTYGVCVLYGVMMMQSDKDIVRRLIDEDLLIEKDAVVNFVNFFG